MAVTDQIILSNDVIGQAFPDDVFTFNFIQENSALTGSAITGVGGPMRSSGHIVDFWIGVVTPATSASGFVSGTITAQPRINSIAVLSTAPTILMAGSAGQAVRTNTQTSTAQTVKAVLGPLASCRFSAGDQLAIDWNCVSAGSAAAGAAGTGFGAVIRVRWNSN